MTKSSVGRRALLVVFACDLVRKGAELGPESKARLRKALEVYHHLVNQGYAEVWICMSAGFSPDRKKYPDQENPVSFLQYRELILLGAPDSHLIWADKSKWLDRSGSTWGSAAEMGEGIRHRKWLEEKTGDRVELHFVSSDYHERRLRMIAKEWYELDQSKVTVHTVTGEAVAAAIEPLKFFTQAMVIATKRAMGKGPVRH